MTAESLPESPIEKAGRRGGEEPPRWTGTVTVEVVIRIFADAGFTTEQDVRDAVLDAKGDVGNVENVILVSLEPDQDPAEPDGEDDHYGY